MSDEREKWGARKKFSCAPSPQKGGTKLREEHGTTQRGTPARSARSKRTIFRRTVFLMLVCGVILFIPLLWKLWDIAIVNHGYQHIRQELM